MAQLVGACPSCSSSLEVRRLECPACGVSVEGRFEQGPLARLSREELSFVEVFLRARGKIKDVEEELGISYPTVVSRLNELLVSMGFESQEEDLGARRQRILDDLSAGRLSAAEATEQLRDLGARDGS
ncbi:MAG: DUF2089 domain-containing protein [Dehalococcoidia bacterium]